MGDVVADLGRDGPPGAAVPPETAVRRAQRAGLVGRGPALAAERRPGRQGAAVPAPGRSVLRGRRRWGRRARGGRPQPVAQARQDRPARSHGVDRVTWVAMWKESLWRQYGASIDM